MIWQHKDDVTGSINVDEWWRNIESKLLEAVVFNSTRLEPLLATEITPPSCRGKVINTEHLKQSKQQDNSSALIGCPKMLAELIRKGFYNPLDLKSVSTESLQEVCSLVGIPIKKANTTRVCASFQARIFALLHL